MSITTDRALHTSARHLAAQTLTLMSDALASACKCSLCAALRERYARVVDVLEEWLGSSVDIPITFTGQSREYWIIDLVRARVEPRLGTLVLHLLYVVGERLEHTEDEKQKNEIGSAILYYALCDEKRARSLWLSLPTRTEVAQDREQNTFAALRKVKRSDPKKP